MSYPIRRLLLLSLSVSQILSSDANGRNLRTHNIKERELNTCIASVSSPDSNCFQDQKLTGGRGCDDNECEAAVCACDPYCCSVLWDLSCSSNVNFFTPGCSAGQLCCVQGVASEYSFDTPVIFGSGCASGSYTIRDGSNPYVDLSSYTAQNVDVKRSFDRKACSYAVPVTVNPGYYISVTGFGYSGNRSGPSGTSSKFNAEHFFASMEGTKLEQTYTTSGNIDIMHNGVVNSPCGGSFIFRINSSIVAQGLGNQITIDKAFSFNVQSFPC